VSAVLGQHQCADTDLIVLLGGGAPADARPVCSGHREGDETGTTMLSVAAHIGQAKVRKSNPGLCCSRSERIIGASQSVQNGRSLVALPWKNEGTERLSMTHPLIGRERNALSHR
jgi:hypothetical protein